MKKILAELIQAGGETFVSLENAVFWNVMHYGCCKNERFEGTHPVHHQVNTYLRVRNNVSSNYQPKHPEKKHSQKTTFFIVTAVKTSTLTLVSAIHKLTNSTWNKEKVPDQWKVSVIVSVYKMDNKPD
jgi:hypothetical protein